MSEGGLRQVYGCRRLQATQGSASGAMSTFQARRGILTAEVGMPSGSFLSLNLLLLECTTAASVTEDCMSPHILLLANCMTFPHELMLEAKLRQLRTGGVCFSAWGPVHKGRGRA